jgi:hypothetical protein
MFNRLSSTAIGVGLLVLGYTTSASASANYARRNGVAGEIKYVRVCNDWGNYNYDALIEASSEGSAVISATLRMKLREQYKTILTLAWVPYGRGDSDYTWKSYGTAFNIRASLATRFYRVKGSSSLGNFLHPGEEVHVGNRIRYKRNEWNAPSYEFDGLGGNINLGTIGNGNCKTYDDGRIY